MDQSSAIHLMRQALFLAILIPAPILIVSLIIGVVVSIFQAVTQIHEMTLVFVPKIVATAFILYVTGSWMLSMLVNFTHQLFMQIPMLGH